MKTGISGLQLALRASVAAAAAYGIADLASLDYPIYAFIAAVIATDLVPSQSRYLAGSRLLATLIGASCGAVLSALLEPGTVSLGCSILFAMVVCYVLQGQDGSRIAGYISGIIVLEHSTDPWIYAFFRSLETGLGVSVAVAVSCIPLLIKIDQPATPGSSSQPERPDSSKR